jgi:phosphoribosylformylglycinamidine (FGAM) synthase-like enzyme
MKKIIFLIALLTGSAAHADDAAVSRLMGLGMSGALASQVDANYYLGTLETVAGAGTTVADAAQLAATTNVHRITGANGTVGWKLSASSPVNTVKILLNTTAGVAKIYAESGGTVNGGAADAAFSALTGIKPIICVKTAALTYICS